MAEVEAGLQEGTTQATNGEGTGIEKFKSAEDRDKAYTELEKRSHSQAQELAELKRQMEDFNSSQQLRQQPQQEKQFTDVYKSESELKQFWERFAQKPQEVFSEWQNKALEQFESRLAQRDAARDAVSDFKAKHPDLAPYEEIVSVYVQRQPQSLSPRERLERAAPEARKMIASIAQKKSAGDVTIDPNTFVEVPSGSRDSAASRTVVAAPSQEDELSEYMKERREAMAGRFNLPQKGVA